MLGRFERMLALLERMLALLERALACLGSASLALLAAGVFAQVVLRYAFGITPVWSEEICRLLLVWIVVCGAAVSVRTNQHIRVEFIVERFPARLRRAWYLLVDLATLTLFAVLVGAGIEAVMFNHAISSVALLWPMSYLIAAIPLGFAAAALFLAARLWQGGRRP
jgi:TRAP-type C4-dicarboxylate transport system permease small subunit